MSFSMMNKSRLRLAIAASGGLFVSRQAAVVSPFLLDSHHCKNIQGIKDARHIHNSNTLFKLRNDISETSARRKSYTKMKAKNKKNDIENESFRADRVVSTRASISRSVASDMIKSRKVAYKVSEDDDTLTPIKNTKLKIPMNAIIYMNGVPLPPIPPMLLAYHKPKNVLSAMDEKHSTTKKHLGMVLPDSYKKYGMHPVGRLDYDTSGLILFSRNGDLTQRLLHPKYNIEKEYVATVAGGKINNDKLYKQLEETGVETSEGTHFAKVLHVEQLDDKDSKFILQNYLKCKETEGQEERDERIIAAAQSDKEQLNKVTLSVQEGKYRMVRRMLANCGHPVVELKRERHGSVILEDLEVGEFRACSEEELQWASSLLK